MLTMIAAVLSCSLGVYLSARMIAALCRVIDLWYALRREWLRVARGILGWSGAIVVAVLLTDGDAFLWGFVCYAVVFVALSLASQLWFSSRLRE